MQIPDIGGMVYIRVPATGLRYDTIATSLADAMRILREFKTSEPAAQHHEVSCIYQPHAFSIGED